MGWLLRVFLYVSVDMGLYSWYLCPEQVWKTGPIVKSAEITVMTITMFDILIILWNILREMFY